MSNHIGELRDMYDKVRRSRWPELGEYTGEGANGVVFIDKNDLTRVVKVTHAPALAFIEPMIMGRLRRVRARASSHIMKIHAFGHGLFHEDERAIRVMWYHGERLRPVRGFQKGLALLRAAETAGVFHEDIALADDGYHHNIMQDAQGELKFIDVEDIRFRRTKDYVGSDYYSYDVEDPGYTRAVRNGTRM